MDQNPSYHVITLEVPQSQQDDVQGILYTFGCLGLEEEASPNPAQAKLRCYFDAHEALSAFQLKLSALLPQALVVMATTIDLNAIQAMIPTFEPVEILPGIHIVPPEDVPHNETITSGQILVIRPGMGFGTGRHETTQLVMKAMIGHAKNAQRLLDVGSGSGILSIFGEHILHTPVIDAVEIDAHARENAAENFELNAIKSIRQLCDITSVKTESYDLIVANIISSTLIYLKKYLLGCLSQNGFLILSGILDVEKEEILAAFSELTLVEISQDKEWLAFVYKKN